MKLKTSDLSDLKKAKMILENPGVAAKITNLIGIPIEKGFKLLPDNWNEKIGDVTQTALTKAVYAASTSSAVFLVRSNISLARV